MKPLMAPRHPDQPRQAILSIGDALGRALLDIGTGKRSRSYSGEYGPLLAFLKACTRPAFGCRTQSAALHQAYLEWSVENGQSFMTNSMLTRRLKDIGMKTVLSCRVYWVDLELIPFRSSANGKNDDQTTT